MLIKRLQYGLLLIGAAAYYLASGEWLSWILLLTVLILPWLSLLVSLPVIRKFRLEPEGAATLEVGQEAELFLQAGCDRPMPEFRGKIRLTELLTGESWRYYAGDEIDTSHCGGLLAEVVRARVYDYLGVFALPVRRCGRRTVIIRPRPLPVDNMPEPKVHESESWVPKRGGGFSENSENRSFRPGDNLSRIHWKLSAKVGELIVREPMEPVRNKVCLSLSVQGSPEELDRKFGRLLWAGHYLLERELNFEIRAMTGSGAVCLTVADEEQLLQAVDTLLCTPAAAEETACDAEDAAWHYHIGGDADET